MLRRALHNSVVASIPHTRGIAATAARGYTYVVPALLGALTLLHCILYIWLLPAWQAPDEPTQFEYAALVAELGRVPSVADRDPALEQQIGDSLVRAHFFEYLVGHALPQSPRTLDDARAAFFMPRQVGGDPPLYFLLAALPLKLLTSTAIETQLLALRVLGALLTAGAVVCVYGAARELFGSDRFALAAGLVVALQPMFMFIGVGVGNDSLANLLGAALCWALLRLLRRGASARRLALLLALALLGLLTKRTLLPELLLLALGGGIWAAVRIGGRLRDWPARVGAVAALLGLGLCVWVVFDSGRDRAGAADWNGNSATVLAARVLAAPQSGQPALLLPRGQTAVQELPDVAAEWAQNQQLHASAQVWSATGVAHGRLVIDFGWATAEQSFEADAHARTVQVATFIPLYAPYLHVVLRSDAGTLYADRFSAESDRQRGLNLLSNADVAEAGFRFGALPTQLRRYLRIRELGWVWRSGGLLQPPPLGWALVRIFFVSFWGQFGWMSLPLVGATPWEGMLALVCVGGLLGSLSWLALPGRPAWRRRAVALLLLVIVAGVLLPLLNAYTQPRSQTIQQGRYLFPALAPIALLLALGWRTLLPARWRLGGLVMGVVVGLCLSGAALQLIARFYVLR
jgi:Dolichyl-phosphate-mannose-protein mannosyltransferase